MKNIKNVRRKYIIVAVGENIGLIPFDRSFSEKESILSGVKSNFDTKVLEIAQEVEKTQLLRLDGMQALSSSVLTDLQMLSDDRLNEDVKLYVSDLKDIELRVQESIMKMNNERDELFTNIDGLMMESLSEEISFLNRGVSIHTRQGELNSALELKQLISSMLKSASEVISGIIGSFEEAMYLISNEIKDVIKEKTEKAKLCTEKVRDNVVTIMHDRYENEIENPNMYIDSPKTHNELKKYLESNGFEIERHNGSHQIYKNAQNGEVRVLPSRRGAHVLAPKTRKRIIQGVSGM